MLHSELGHMLKSKCKGTMEDLHSGIRVTVLAPAQSPCPEHGLPYHSASQHRDLHTGPALQDREGKIGELNPDGVVDFKTLNIRGKAESPDRLVHVSLDDKGWLSRRCMMRWFLHHVHLTGCPYTNCNDCSVIHCSVCMLTCIRQCHLGALT